MKNQKQNKIFLCLKSIIVIAVLGLSGLFGCGVEYSNKKPNENKVENPVVEAPKQEPATPEPVKPDKAKPSLESLITLKITPMPAPFIYEAQMQWPKGLKEVSIYLDGGLIYKSKDKDTTSFKVQLPHNSEHSFKFYTDKSSILENKESFTFSEEALNPSGSVENKNIGELIFVTEDPVKIPVDVHLTISKLKAPPGSNAPLEIKAGRVFINQEMPLYTYTYDVNISADEFIVLYGCEILYDEVFPRLDCSKQIKTPVLSDMSVKDEDKFGVIRTFREVAMKGSRDVDGKSGGVVFIKARKALGNLKVFMYGQDGGVGSDGIPYRDDERAAKGADGTMAEYPGCVNDSLAVSVFSPLMCTCDFRTAQNEFGKMGSKGSNGRAGKNGGRGGDSGIFRMEVSESSAEFNFTVESKAGVSGTPGKGGPPQKGGLGGTPVTKDKFTYSCMADLTVGPEGPPGDKNGADGIKQPDGHVEKSCVSIGDGYGRCSF